MAETTAEGAGKAANPSMKVDPVVDKTQTDAAASTETNATDNVGNAKSRFTAAMEEARAGAEALRDEAMQRGKAYQEKIAGASGQWHDDARTYAADAKVKAAALASEGKTRASDALAAVGKTIADTASTVDEKLGPQYGDYARNAARWTQETAAKLESKDFAELGEDVKEFVRKSPGTALGIAAVAGFVVSRMLSGSGRSED
jgi:ElaB/YqjD/DUF883 family membrane-anchored ribosome-binding protein